MKSSFFEHLRLAGFPLGLGLTSVLVSGTLNRVMIVEMGIPAGLVGLFFALPLLISSLRVWLGYRSDAYPLWGLRREPLILIGSLLAGLSVVTFIMLILSGALTLTGVFLVLVFFLGVSTGLSASGMLSAVIDFTTTERADLLMGVWGVAHNLGQATGNMISGATVDLVQALQGDALTAYGLVFALEAALLLGALWLLKNIKITEARVFSKTDLGQPDLLYQIFHQRRGS